MKSSRGFTLIEVMIVLVIIGVLAALAIPRFGAMRRHAQQSEADLLLKQVYTLQMAYYDKFNAYAASMNDLETVGWAPPDPLAYFGPPTIVSGGGPGSTSYEVCMVALVPDLSNRSINESRQFDTC